MIENKKRLAEITITAACGHEYCAKLIYIDEDDLLAQCAMLAQYDCLECIEKKYAAQVAKA